MSSLSLVSREIRDRVCTVPEDSSSMSNSESELLCLVYTLLIFITPSTSSKEVQWDRSIRKVGPPAIALLRRASSMLDR